MLTQRQVKEAIMLADKLKDGPFDSHGFNVKLTEVKNEFHSLSENNIDNWYLETKQQERLHRINEGSWMLGIVELENCLTWDQFGEREWARMAPVNVTTEEVRRRKDLSDPLWAMAKRVHLFFASLPIVVIRKNKNPSKFYIDDGSNRAVAYYLAGFREAVAYIGVVREEINHKWEWPAW